MKKIRVSIEYGCDLLWLYDEGGRLIRNGFPTELKNHAELVALNYDILEIYHGLFVNNSVTFEYIGFQSEKEKQDFLSKVYRFIEVLKKEADSNYQIEIESLKF